VHINAGVAALVAAKLLGARKGHGKTPMPPHNVPFALLGTGLLWFGWLGFNGGSALGANASAVVAFVATFAAAAAAGLVWALLDVRAHGKVTGVGLASGIVAGLVGITPGSGYVGPVGAIVIGALSALVSYASVRILPKRLGVDDSLDVFGVHGMAGLFGSIVTGVFASVAVNPGGADGLLFGDHSLKLLGVQVVASLVPLAWSGAFSFGALRLIDATIGLRVDADAEAEGLDLAENNEAAYGEGIPSGKVIPSTALVSQSESAAIAASRDERPLKA
jgi:Amt family ammonium transporter